MRVDGRAVAEGFLPPGLEGGRQFVAHPVRGVRVQATHSRHLVAESLLGQDLRDAIFSHPGLVTVSQAMSGQAGLDRKPADKWDVLRDGLDSPASGRGVTDGGAGICARARLGGRPGSDRDARPDGGVGDDQAGGSARRCFMPSVAGRAEHAAGVIAAPVVSTVRTEEHVVPAAAMLVGAGAPPAGMVLDLERDQVLKEPGKVDGQLRLPRRAAVGVILRR